MELASNLMSVLSPSTKAAMISSGNNDFEKNLQTIQYIISNLKNLQDHTAKNPLNAATSYNTLSSNPDYVNLINKTLVSLNANTQLNPGFQYQVIQELLSCILSSSIKQDYSLQQSLNHKNSLAPLLSFLGNNQSLTSEQLNTVQSVMDNFATDSSKKNEFK